MHEQLKKKIMNFIVFITFMQEFKFFIGMLYMTNFFFDIQRYIYNDSNANFLM